MYLKNELFFLGNCLFDRIMSKISFNHLLFASGISFAAVFINIQCTSAKISENQPFYFTFSEVQSSRKNILSTFVLSQRKDWEITKELTDRTCTHKTFGVFSRHKTTKLWWSRDNAGHGGSVWKVFDETSKSLEWKTDADRYGDFIAGKHKGPTGTSIPFAELSCR
jgi:hypothetical protein